MRFLERPVKFERNFGGGPILSGENSKILVSASGAQRVILIMPRHLYSGVLTTHMERGILSMSCQPIIHEII